MNPIPIVEFANLYEVQEYMTITNHLFAPQMWMVNQNFWDSLSDAEKDLVRSSVYAAITTSRGIANAIEASDRGVPFLKEKMEVNSLSPEDKAKMAELAVPAARAIIEKSFGDEGRKMLEELLAAVAQAGK
jgi:TRAP-type C4-dicarboxylate transport system substrate-binding protein